MEIQHTDFERVQKIVSEIKNEFEALKEESKNALETNPALYKAVKEFGGVSMMIDTGFEFRAFSSGAVNENDHLEYLRDYVEKNKDRLQLENLEKLFEVFKERKQDFLEKLKTPVAEEDAEAACEKIHKELVLKPLDTPPLFN